MSKIINQQVMDIALKLYEDSDLKLFEISNITGISEAEIYKVRKERKLSTRTQRLFDEAAINSAAKLYADGWRVDDILEITGVPQNRLYEAIDRLGIDRRNECSTRIKQKTKVQHIREDEIIEAYTKNLNYSEISREVGVPFSTVKSVINSALKDNKVQESERYQKEKGKDNYYYKVAGILLNSEKDLSIREVSKAFRLEEKKMYYIVSKLKGGN